MKRLLALLLSLGAASTGAREALADAPGAIRATPVVYAYELAASRRLSSVVVQNTVVANPKSTERTITQVRYEVLRGADIVATRTLHVADLDGAAKSGAAIAPMLDVLAFQFPPKVLFPGGKPTFAATRTLAPGEVLWIGAQALVFSGKPETVRIVVEYASGAPDDAALAIRHGPIEGPFRFPLKGTWIAGAGSTPHSHHRWAIPEEFAFDFVQYGASGRTYANDGAEVTDYYAYGEPVLAAADGEVVSVHDDLPDNVDGMRRPGEPLAAYQTRLLENQATLLAAGLKAVAGNVAIVKHREHVYSVYSHLKPKSAKVRKGDRVKAGQPIGEVGTSGNSTEPHLHFHVCDAPDALMCTGLPVQFVDAEIPFAESPRQIQSGDWIEVVSPARDASTPK